MIYRVDWGGKQRGRAACVVEAESKREARQRAIERMAAAGLNWKTVASVKCLSPEACASTEGVTP